MYMPAPFSHTPDLTEAMCKGQQPWLSADCHVQLSLYEVLLHSSMMVSTANM